MKYFKNFFLHLKTITNHKFKVTYYLFKTSMYKQAILHDLSKYHPEELICGIKYYQGFRSPIDKEKELYGFSKAWLHHKGHNKHHWEYWIDHSNGKITCHDMETRYLLESILDRIAAAKNYLKNNYNNASAFDYFNNGNVKRDMNFKTAIKTFYLLDYLKKNGEKALFHHIKYLYKESKKNNDILNKEFTNLVPLYQDLIQD